MQIVFLPSSLDDLAWFKKYYVTVFPDGADKANSQFLAIQQLLIEDPYIGVQNERFDEIRELKIPRIPFTAIYRVKNDRMEILRILDERSKNPFRRKASNSCHHLILPSYCIA